MQAVNERPNECAVTIDKSASILGLHEFSLLSRIQAGEIKYARARSGEMMIPVDELERLAPDAAKTHSVDSGQESAPVSDEQLGIKKTFGGLRQNGEYRVRFTVPGYERQFTASEKESYRAAFGASARELESATKLKEQLKDASGLSEFSEGEIKNPQIGRWDVPPSSWPWAEAILCFVSKRTVWNSRSSNDSGPDRLTPGATAVPRYCCKETTRCN